MIRLTLPSSQNFEGILALARQAQPTYVAIGATAGAKLPTGYLHDRQERRLGGPEHFGRAKEGLRTWQAHIGSGAQIYPSKAVVVEGASVLVHVRVGPLWIVAPCRVVYVIDEPDRFGLAYGTLPGHPESGEEAFIVERGKDSTIFRIVAFSQAAEPLARLGGPITRSVQRRATRQYLAALANFVMLAD